MAKKKKTYRRKKSMGIFGRTIKPKLVAAGAVSEQVGRLVSGALAGVLPPSVKVSPQAAMALGVGMFMKSNDLFSWGIGQLLSSFIPDFTQ